GDEGARCARLGQARRIRRVRAGGAGGGGGGRHARSPEEHRGVAPSARAVRVHGRGAPPFASRRKTVSHDLDVLPADVRSMLRAERSRGGVPEGARLRLAKRLAASVPGFGPALLPAAAAALPHGAWVATGVKVLVVLALGGGIVATYEAVDHPSAKSVSREN